MGSGLQKNRFVYTRQAVESLYTGRQYRKVFYNFGLLLQKKTHKKTGKATDVSSLLN